MVYFKFKLIARWVDIYNTPGIGILKLSEFKGFTHRYSRSGTKSIFEYETSDPLGGWQCVHYLEKLLIQYNITTYKIVMKRKEVVMPHIKALEN